ncbi:MAG TPA: addiction module protein [Thermoanaerobaculia bacterium]|nr:addiction module protein [Thermoanaerobaculia bacterium]
MRQDLLEEGKKLSFPERIELAEAIWDSVPRDATEDQLDVPESHRQILDQRLASEKKTPESGSDWPEVRDRLRRKL